MNTPNKRKGILQYYVNFDFDTFQGKITISFSLIALLSLSMMFYPIYVYQNLIYRYDFTFQNTVPTKYYCSMIEVALIKSNSTLDNYLLTNDKFFLEKRHKLWNEDYKLALDTLLSFTRLWDSPLATSLVYNVSSRANALHAEQDMIVRSFHQNQNVKSIQERANQINRLDLHIEEILSLLESIMQLQEAEIRKAQFTRKSELTSLPMVMLLIFILILIIGISIGYSVVTSILLDIRKIRDTIRNFVMGNIPEQMPATKNELNTLINHTNKLADYLKGIKEFAFEVGKRNFDVKGTSFVIEGELGESLNEMREQLRIVSEEDAKRNWTASNLSNLNTLMRNHIDDIQILCDKVISELIKSLSANQGAIYLAQHSDNHIQQTYLKLASWYAFHQKKHREKEVQIGEGILGEAFQERRTVYMDNLPSEYTTIQSGLGKAQPQTLLIVPIMTNEELYGMVEIASFQILENHKIEFVERVCEILAATLKSAYSTEKTQRLLEKAQLSAEALRSQEEEMRQNLEELQATQEELRRQRKELDLFMGALSISTVMIEFDRDRRILSVNNKFCELLQYSRSEVEGKSQTLFVPEDVIAKGEYEEFWKDIQRGSYMMRDVKRKKKDGTTLWLRAHYIPVTDDKGELQKIIALSTDITDEVLNRMKIEQQRETDRKRSEVGTQNQERMMRAFLKRYQESEKTLKDKVRQLEQALGSGY